MAGAIEVPVVKLRGDRAATLVSTGVPFAPGQLLSERNVAILLDGREISIGTKTLARWPQDGSIRSVLVQFPLRMDAAQQRVSLQWGRPRSAPDISVRLIEDDFPEALMVLPARWLCDSQVIGEQVPLYDHAFPEYDKRLMKTYPKRRDDPKTGDIRDDGDDSTPHVFYQLYVRSGDLDMLMAARRELLAYRETRSLYVEGLADDYLLTGDERSRTAASYMADRLTQQFPPEHAASPKGATTFWTKREAAFPLLGALAYYEISGDRDYEKIADAYLANLYKTQLEWAGSPFMTGLLLEAVVKHHQLTGSETAARSLFLALDRLMGQARAPDLNLSIAHAFGYGYKISGYARTDYRMFGEKVFTHGVNSALLDDRASFNQAYRSSGHFLAYLTRPAAAVPAAPSPVPQPLPEPQDGAVLFHTDFETGLDGWLTPVRGTLVDQDASTAFSGRRALRVRREPSSLELSVAKRFEQEWLLAEHPRVRLAYRIPPGVGVGLRVLTTYGDWIYLGGTAGQPRDGAPDGAPILRDDGTWHELTLNAAEEVHRVLAGIEALSEFQLFSRQGAAAPSQFWIDAFSITR